jgi:hypothetical protein
MYSQSMKHNRWVFYQNVRRRECKKYQNFESNFNEEEKVMTNTCNKTEITKADKKIIVRVKKWTVNNSEFKLLAGLNMKLRYKALLKWYDGLYWKTVNY